MTAGRPGAERRYELFEIRSVAVGTLRGSVRGHESFEPAAAAPAGEFEQRHIPEIRNGRGTLQPAATTARVAGIQVSAPFGRIETSLAVIEGTGS